MHNDCLIDPIAARRLPEDSHERALARLALRQWWHIVLDPCPALVKEFPPDGLAVLDPFLQDASERKLSMRWPLQGHLLAWLEERHAGRLSQDAATEILAAAAARWSNTDQSSDLGIVLCFSGRFELAVAGWKSRGAADEHRVVLLELPGTSKKGIFFARLQSREYPTSFRWQPLPA